MKPFWLCMLGTSAMTPTVQRAHPSVYVQYEGLGILLDAGEGVQRQLRLAGINQSKIRLILLSHWHADHALGLIGLLQSLALHNVQDEVILLGPAGSGKRLRAAFTAFGGKPGYPLRVLEAPVDEKGVFQLFGLTIRTLPVEHAQPTIAFRIEEPARRKILIEKVRSRGVKPGPCLKALQEGRDADCQGIRLPVEEYTLLVPGRSIVYATDFLIDDRVAAFARNADVFICEATFTEEHADKAAAHAHLTAREAGMLAAQAKPRLLVLTHFSQRYDDTRVLVGEAAHAFDGNILAAEDFTRITIDEEIRIDRCVRDDA